MQKNNQVFENFSNYHRQRNPLILGNVWDVPSALQLQKLGFKALGTSSAAIASILGYEDGEQMPFSEYVFIIKRIAASTSLPLSVDLEAGYGNDPETVANNILRLSKLGVVGINLEDSVVQNGTRRLVDIAVFQGKLESIHRLLKTDDVNVFINMRIDTFLLGLPEALEESKDRINQYSSFVDGIFLPCISSEQDIKQIVDHTSLPLNVMSMPGLPDFKKLRDLGVKRISTGNFLHDFMKQTFNREVSEIVEQKDFNAFFSHLSKIKIDVANGTT